jgi:hypothetical protein
MDKAALEAKFGLVKVPAHFGNAFVQNASMWKSTELEKMGLSGYFMDCDSAGNILPKNDVNILLNFMDKNRKQERWLKCTVEMMLSVDKPVVMRLIEDYATKQQSFQ